MSTLRLALSILLLLSFATPLAAQQSIVRLDIDVLQSAAMNPAMRVQSMACSHDTCIVVFGGMRDSASTVAWPSIYWSRSIGTKRDGVFRVLPDWARPTGALAVAPDRGGFLVVWADAGGGRPGVFAARLDGTGAIAAAPWLVFESQASALRLFDASDGHLLVVGTADTQAIVHSMRGLQTSLLDTLINGIKSIVRIHGWNSIVAITYNGITELRDIDSYALVGRTFATRFGGTYRFESDGGLWTMIDSTLSYYARFDDLNPASTVTTEPILTPFARGVWIARNSNSDIEIAYVMMDRDMRATVKRRRLDSNGKMQPVADETFDFYKGGWDITSSSLRMYRVETAGMRVPAVRFEYSYTEVWTGNGRSGTTYGAIVIEPDGRTHFMLEEGPWIPIDASGDGLPIRLHRIAASAGDQLQASVIASGLRHDFAVPFAKVRVESNQRLPAIVKGDSGLVITWIEEPPNVRRSAQIARWSDANRSLTITGSIKERSTGVGTEYSQEARVAQWRHSGASIVTLVESEVNRPARQSHPAWDAASWSARRTSPAGVWDAKALGTFKVDYMSRPPLPAGGRFFYLSAYDPARDEVLMLAANGLDDLALHGIASTTARSWSFTLPVNVSTAIALVPIDSAIALMIFGDTLRRVTSSARVDLPNRLIHPIRSGDVIVREFAPSFLHVRNDSGSVTIDRYALDGTLLGNAAWRVDRGVTGYMLAQRRVDSVIAIVWSEGSNVRLTLLDSRLGVRIADSILARSDGEVARPYAAFIGDELVVAWEDWLAVGSDIAMMRDALGTMPASIATPTRSDQINAPMVRVPERVISNGRIALELRRGLAGPMHVGIFDARGRCAHQETIDVTGRTVNLQVEGLSAGAYFVRAVADGESTVVRVAIIQ